MIKAKEISLKNLAIFLLFSIALSAGYFIARPHGITTAGAPIFIGEEVVVKQATRPITAAQTVKAATVPLPAPGNVAPLPLVPPLVNFKVLPVYPAAALGKGLEGTVILSVYVGLSGQPEKIEAKLSSGIAELDAAASAAVSQWRFSPATQGGQALASWFEVPVRFAIK